MTFTTSNETTATDASVQSKPSTVISSSKTRDHSLGLFYLLVTVVFFIVGSHLTQQINLPFFVTYLNTSFNFIFLLPFLFRQSFSKSIAGDSGVMSPRETMKLAAFFCPLLLCMNFLFNWSLSYTSISSNTIISSTSGIFAVAFSYVILRTPLNVLNSVGALFSILGAVLVSSVDAEQGGAIKGNVAAAVSSALSGLYTVLLKKQIPTDNVDMTLFFGVLGVVNMIGFLPVVLVLNFTGVESPLELNDQLFMLLLNGVITIVASYTWARSVVLTSPIIGVIGLGMTTPLALIDDVFLQGKTFTALYYCGAGVIIVGFLITNWKHSTEKELNLQPANSITLEAPHESVV